MANIRELIEKRDKLFKDQSENILTHIEHVTNGVRDFLIGIDPSYIPGEFQWEDISVFDDGKDNDDPILMLIGFVVYPVGTQLTMEDGTLAIIDEENQEYFNRILRMGVPFSIVHKFDSAAIREFLEKVAAATQPIVAPLDDDDLQEITQSLDEDIEQAQELADKKAKTIPVQQKAGEYDFDMDELTEEQREALRLFKLSSR